MPICVFDQTMKLLSQTIRIQIIYNYRMNSVFSFWIYE